MKGEREKGEEEYFLHPKLQEIASPLRFERLIDNSTLARFPSSLFLCLSLPFTPFEISTPFGIDVVREGEVGWG